MQVNAKNRSKTTIHLHGFEQHEDIVADIVRLVMDAGRMKSAIVIYFPDHFFNGEDRLARVYEWMDNYILEYGAFPDMVWYFDFRAGRIVQYGTAISKQPLYDTAA